MRYARGEFTVGRERWRENGFPGVQNAHDRGGGGGGAAVKTTPRVGASLSPQAARVVERDINALDAHNRLESLFQFDLSTAHS